MEQWSGVGAVVKPGSSGQVWEQWSSASSAGQSFGGTGSILYSMPGEVNDPSQENGKTCWGLNDWRSHCQRTLYL